jgi:hypothetical protein
VMLSALAPDLDGAQLTSCPPVSQVPAQVLGSRVHVALQQLAMSL